MKYPFRGIFIADQISLFHFHNDKCFAIAAAHLNFPPFFVHWKAAAAKKNISLEQYQLRLLFYFIL